MNDVDDDNNMENIFPDAEDGRKADVIGEEDESSEEDDDDDDKSQGEKDKDKKKNEALEKKKKPRKKVQVFRFKPDMLTNQERGLKFLYENLGKAKVFDGQDKGKFDESKALDRLINYYKEWHFHFMPKYTYKYFLDRCSFFGKGNLLKTYLNNVRRIHRGEINWSDLVQNLEEDQTQASNNNQQNDQNIANIVPSSDQQKQNEINLNASKIIPKQIKETFLPSYKPKAQNNKSTTFSQQQQSQSLSPNIQSQTEDKAQKPQQQQQSQQPQPQKKQTYQEEEEDKEEEDIRKKLQSYEEELLLIGGGDHIDDQRDDYFDEDDYRFGDQEDIKLKRIQK